MNLNGGSVQKILGVFLIGVLFVSCNNNSNKKDSISSDVVISSKYECKSTEGRPSYIKKLLDSIASYDIELKKDTSFARKSRGMQLIPAGEFIMGGVGDLALEREFPRHPVKVDGFYMDTYEVTNAKFSEFVEATGYITVAERFMDWEDMKKQLPPGTPKPNEDLLKPGSMVFTPPDNITNLGDFYQWWSWTVNANWRHPEGPESSIEGKEDHPVVHIALEDAIAYSKWVGKRLPTEAEWEWAARGGLNDPIYPWGDCNINDEPFKANFFQGSFPTYNSLGDKYENTSPVGRFQDNGFGLFDMAGNVWEMTTDNYDEEYYKSLSLSKTTINPRGPEKSNFSLDSYGMPTVIKGGSFLCNDSYCSSYRVSARMPLGLDAAMNHVGFRCVLDIKDSK